MKNFNISTNVYFGENSLGILDTIQDKHVPVSYTHLDVYKRQACGCAGSSGSKCRTAGAGRTDDRADTGRQPWGSDPYKYQRHGQRSDGRLY